MLPCLLLSNGPRQPSRERPVLAGVVWILDSGFLISLGAVSGHVLLEIATCTCDTPFRAIRYKRLSVPRLAHPLDLSLARYFGTRQQTRLVQVV